jgi:UDP-2-acetamido-3-amino-2,3-dideoxy-glucuronate N-acetyltransferase
MLPENLQTEIFNCLLKLQSEPKFDSIHNIIQILNASGQLSERQTGISLFENLIEIKQEFVESFNYQLWDAWKLTALQSDFYSHPSSVVDIGALIGVGTKIWHFCHIQSGAIIGQNCNIGQNVFIANDVSLGNNTKVQNNVSLYTGVLVESDVFIGPSVVFTNVINPRTTVNRKSEYQTTIVERGASIGANATIICGNRIGKYAFIGAGSVVTKNVPDFALVTGNPGRVVGFMGKTGHKLISIAQDQFRCPDTGAEYLLKDKILKEI